MGHEIAYRRDKGIRVHDLHGINTAGVTIDEIAPRHRQLPEPRLPARGAICVGRQNPAVVEQGVLAGPE
jgi:hypothetical protein